jgi:hypothetical protein
MHDEHERERGELRDRGKILDRVIREFLQTGSDRKADRGDEQRVPVGRGLGDGVGADRAAAAGTIVDDDGVAPASEKRCAIRRPILSVVPPATNGTTSSICFLG